jgi:nucleoside-diphosphate kinase
MLGKVTFSMIKPDAVNKGYSGAILKMMNDAGFRIVAMKQVRLSTNAARQFYEIHKGRPFYEDLITFMTSGPVISLVLEKENAVEDFRKLIGNTDPNKAEEGTVRKLYAENMQRNAVHGADSDQNAIREAAFHFAGKEMFDKDGVCIG